MQKVTETATCATTYKTGHTAGDQSNNQPTNSPVGVLPGTAPVKGAPFLDDECVKLQLEVSEKVGGTHFVRTRMQ